MVARIVLATRGARPSTTATTTAQHAPGQLAGVAVVAHDDAQIPRSLDRSFYRGARGAQRGRGHSRPAAGRPPRAVGNPQ